MLTVCCVWLSEDQIIYSVQRERERDKFTSMLLMKAVTK